MYSGLFRGLLAAEELNQSRRREAMLADQARLNREHTQWSMGLAERGFASQEAERARRAQLDEGDRAFRQATYADETARRNAESQRRQEAFAMERDEYERRTKDYEAGKAREQEEDAFRRRQRLVQGIIGGVPVEELKPFMLPEHREAVKGFSRDAQGNFVAVGQDGAPVFSITPEQAEFLMGGAVQGQTPGGSRGARSGGLARGDAEGMAGEPSYSATEINAIKSLGERDPVTGEFTITGPARAALLRALPQALRDEFAGYQPSEQEVLAEVRRRAPAYFDAWQKAERGGWFNLKGVGSGERKALDKMFLEAFPGADVSQAPHNWNRGDAATVGGRAAQSAGGVSAVDVATGGGQGGGNAVGSAEAKAALEAEAARRAGVAGAESDDTAFNTERNAINRSMSAKPVYTRDIGGLVGRGLNAVTDLANSGYADTARRDLAIAGNKIKGGLAKVAENMVNADLKNAKQNAEFATAVGATASALADRAVLLAYNEINRDAPIDQYTLDEIKQAIRQDPNAPAWVELMRLREAVANRDEVAVREALESVVERLKEWRDRNAAKTDARRSARENRAATAPAETTKPAREPIGLRYHPLLGRPVTTDEYRALGGR